MKIQDVSSVEVKEKGCPPAQLVAPCICSAGPHPHLTCENIDDVEVLRKIFEKTSKYMFKEVHIEFSVLQYLPHDMFQGVDIRELHLKNVTLVQLFDEPPQNLQTVEILHIENTNVFRGMTWELLQNFTRLRILNIYFNSIPSLGSDFSDQVSDSLEQISFYDTETELLKPGVFMGYRDLDKVAFDRCGITTLTRNIFRRPSNIRFIYFNYNKIKVIPNDMFVEMPLLETLSLRENEIVTLPAPAFDGTLSTIKYLLLEGNPLTCDCRLHWLFRNKPERLSGTCDSPSGYRGLELKDFKMQNLYVLRDSGAADC
ncbi:LRRCT domain-containing protein [Nephila pilipes]|uniref:LRRCT domain-containing protein n=1 Tax=Nephila pilipes TaxID=299642 RepID=A0A8X6PNL4_NEPPI|nr:LRRCT domain-containing protein [Nephila pilipes]